MTNENPKTIEFKPVLYRRYATTLEGRTDSSYSICTEVRSDSGPNLTILTNTKRVLGITDDDLRKAQQEMLWVNYKAKDKLFWKVEPDEKHDFIIREATVERVYHYGLRLYVSDGKQKKEVEQIGFGYDFGRIWKLNKSDLKEVEIKEYGNLTKEKLTQILK